MKGLLGGGLAKSKSSETLAKLSIFNKPRLPALGAISSLKSENLTYDGMGGTSKVLQSDLKANTKDNFWLSSSKTTSVIKKKKLSPSAFMKRQ
jgi:hypothetical protein